MVATPRIQPDPPDSKPGRLLFRNYLTVPYHEEIALREKREYLELLRTLKIKEIEAAEARATKRAERRRERLRAEVPVGGAATRSFLLPATRHGGFSDHVLSMRGGRRVDVVLGTERRPAGRVSMLAFRYDSRRRGCSFGSSCLVGASARAWVDRPRSPGG